jgi:hypothetical protein
LRSMAPTTVERAAIAGVPTHDELASFQRVGEKCASEASANNNRARASEASRSPNRQGAPGSVTRGVRRGPRCQA